jgi:hypothetical protein
MIIEQTIEIMPNRRLELDLPFELPLGMAKLVLSVTPENTETSSRGKSAFGCLRRFADPAKIPGEDGAWEQAVLKKYEKN